jgi:hypothetical protein
MVEAQLLLVGDHCYACTAGAGSNRGAALFWPITEGGTWIA